MRQTATGEQPTRIRRWVADPLPLLGLLAGVAVALTLLGLSGQRVPWWPPALVGVVGAGLALSGST